MWVNVVILFIETDVPHDVPQINVTKQTEARMTADVYTNISRPVATASKAVCCR